MIEPLFIFLFLAIWFASLLWCKADHLETVAFLGFAGAAFILGNMLPIVGAILLIASPALLLLVAFDQDSMDFLGSFFPDLPERHLDVSPRDAMVLSWIYQESSWLAGDEISRSDALRMAWHSLKLRELSEWLLAFPASCFEIPMDEGDFIPGLA